MSVYGAIFITPTVHTAVGNCAMNKFGTFGQAPGGLGAVGTGTGVDTMVLY